MKFLKGLSAPSLLQWPQLQAIGLEIATKFKARPRSTHFRPSQNIHWQTQTAPTSSLETWRISLLHHIPNTISHKLSLQLVGPSEVLRRVVLPSTPNFVISPGRMVSAVSDALVDEWATSRRSGKSIPNGSTNDASETNGSSEQNTWDPSKTHPTRT
jgi:hypothetical protein